MKKQVSKKDIELVRKAQKGNYGSFEKLVGLYEKEVYNIAYKIMRDEEDARDILQETFLKAFEKLSSFRRESNFSTWLYRIAVNLCLMRKRKDKDIRMVSIDKPIVTGERNDMKYELVEDWSESPHATLEDNEVKRVLSKNIDALPEDYKTVFLLRSMNRLSNEAMAKILNTTVPAVKARLHKARLILRYELSKYFKDTRKTA